MRICAVVALTLVALGLSSVVHAAEGGPRIITRNSVTTVTGNTYSRVGSDPVTRNFLTFDGALTSTSESTTHPRLLPHVVVINRPVVEPLAVVEPGLANQPVHPHMIEVFLLGEGQSGSTTIYLDPDVDYENQGSLVLDRDHSINRAQRMANQLRVRRPMILRGNRRSSSSVHEVSPSFILEKPDGVITPRPKRKQPHDTQMVRSD